MEKRHWCPNGELIFTYNFTTKSAFTLCQRNVEIRAFESTSGLFKNIKGNLINNTSQSIRYVCLENTERWFQLNSNRYLILAKRYITFHLVAE